MGWISYPTKSAIQEALRSAEPAAASAAKTLADLMIAHLERLNDADAVDGMVYSALTRATIEQSPSGKGSRFDLLVLAAMHGDLIADLGVAMAVFVAREADGEKVNGAELQALVNAAIGKYSKAVP